MKRRILFASAAAATLMSGAAIAQQAMPVIGVLMLGAQNDPVSQSRAEAFQEGLAARGWTTGKTVRIEYRWAGSEAANVDRFAAELVALKPNVILANGTPSVAALKKATTSIPVVCALVQDPVGLGLVASLGRPGGNITGFTYVDPELIGKWQGLLADIAPSTKRAGMLFNPAINPQYVSFLRDLGPVLKGVIDIVPTPVQSVEALSSAMTRLGSTPNSAAIMAADPFVFAHGKEIAAMALQYRLPTISIYRSFAAEGGLMSYGPDATEIFRRSASYVDRILKGENPAELPLQQPDKFEFVINLKTANALGLTAPPSILALADEVIE